jgi:hypothetical protein
MNRPKKQHYCKCPKCGWRGYLPVRKRGLPKGTRLKVSVGLQTLARSMYRDGMPITHIARQLGLCRPTIYRIL